MLTFQVNFNSEVYVTNKNAAKEMTKHVSCDCKCKCNSTSYIQIKYGITKHVKTNVKVLSILQ